MFQRKIDKIFKELPSVLGIYYNVLVVGNDNVRNHDNTLKRVLLIYREVNLN